ncbi:MAG: 6,7-dimethyl-8-ribityllumazine synthase [Acidimicrobiales bacterium]|nr:MAG: 6,7-dimethyl-8-ribityllumazine synthase [Acidimicrobiales bacterium]
MARDARSPERVGPDLSASGLRIAVVCSRFNDLVTRKLLEGAVRRLRAMGAEEGRVFVEWVPGAFELPLACKKIASTGKVDAVVALGAVIRGETPHFDFVAAEATRGIQEAQLSTGVPVVFGVLTTDDLEQALVRADPELEDKGGEAAAAAVEMAYLVARVEAGAWPGGSDSKEAAG